MRSLRLLHLRARPGRSASRGQSTVELALIAPVLLAFVLGIASFWVNYQRDATYTSAAQTLAEAIARSGHYSPDQGAVIQTILDQAIGVSSSDSYLSVVVLDGPGGSVIDSVGSGVPEGGPAGSPGDTGWDGSINNVLEGYFIQVDIWGYHSIGAPQLGVGIVIVPDGHAAVRSMWVATP